MATLKKKDSWVIFVTTSVLDRRNQVRYQRVIALSKMFNVIIVTTSQLPQALKDFVYEIHTVADSKKLLTKAANVVKQLSHEEKNFYVHTQYAPIPLVIGYLCKKLYGCRWVYDLWDHPSLSWSMKRGLYRRIKQISYTALLRPMLRKSDAWIIAMHPDILSHFPAAPVSCRLIWARPGYVKAAVSGPEIGNTKSMELAINVVYAGTINYQRGLELICNWARKYKGPSIRLHMIGKCDSAARASLQKFQVDIAEKSNVCLKIWGEMLHEKALDVMRAADIGLCPLDPNVLNYRYAYPVKIVEYMALGLIAVATEGHGVKAIVRDGVNGFIAPYEFEGFAAAIDRAIDVVKKPEIKNKMLNAMQDVVDVHDWERINAEIGQHIYELISEKKHDSTAK